MAKKIGVILSGCGVFDGSEIHEAVLTLLALSKNGLDYQCMAPDIDQAHVINHKEGTESAGERRNVLVEAARIARGHVVDVAEVNCDDYDAFVFPGGYGAAKNLSTFAFDGDKCTANEEVARIIRDAFDSRKPLVFLCIAPAVAARVLGRGIELTVGKDPATEAALHKMGATMIPKAVEEAHIDRNNRIVSAPAYMYDAPITEIEKSINAAVTGLMELLNSPA